MIGLHMLSHTDDKDHALHCSACAHTIAYNLMPVFSTDSPCFKIENTEQIVQKTITKNYRFSFSNPMAIDRQLSRPPPVQYRFLYIV